MEDNKDQKQDETSKTESQDPNVNPQDPASDGKPTGDGKSTEPSKGADNDGTQAKIQKHAELREKAEKEAKEAKEKADRITEENNRLRKEKIELLIKTRIEKSNLPQALKDRAFSNPIKFVSGNSTKDMDTTNLPELEKAVAEELDGLVNGLEKDLGATASVFSTTKFVDSDNVSHDNSGGKTLSYADIAKMTPHQIAQLPEDVKQQMRLAGSQSK